VRTPRARNTPPTVPVTLCRRSTKPYEVFEQTIVLRRGFVACKWRSQLLRCAEFFKICARVGLGFAVLGFVGFFVKMIFIVRYLPVAVCWIAPKDSACVGLVHKAAADHSHQHPCSSVLARQSMIMQHDAAPAHIPCSLTLNRSLSCSPSIRSSLAGSRPTMPGLNVAKPSMAHKPLRGGAAGDQQAHWLSAGHMLLSFKLRHPNAAHARTQPGIASAAAAVICPPSHSLTHSVLSAEPSAYRSQRMIAGHVAWHICTKLDAS
jgi:hypothetical protein